jgi:Z1 domain/Type III restriction enzyme, res subunit
MEKAKIMVDAPDFDINRFKNRNSSTSQYDAQIDRLINQKINVNSIEAAVGGAIRNIAENRSRSFVIYGEPQSGKTEMMICLTAKLVDAGYEYIVHLLNDSVDLLNQNLGRFKSSGLAPSARNFSEVLDPDYVLKGRKHVIFCKKNARDLEKLLDKLAVAKSTVVIDDEADYASPNAKINKGTKTTINRLIGDLIGKGGIYIGVTATPARLDVNNTFDNDSELWVNFPPHPLYTGQDVFFPLEGNPDYKLNLLPDQGDEPKYAREALFGFLVGVAFLNKHSVRNEKNYSMLVHTSGKKADHSRDWKEIVKTLEQLSNPGSTNYEKYVSQIWNLAQNSYPQNSPDDITGYIVDNISRHSVIVLNSDKVNSFSDGTASNPTSLFTIIIGGNIVSRGVTFNNLLSMFFTRDVKNKIQQDTYIQRARMFGARGNYLGHFQLTIPKQLYADWHRCFVFHKLALAAIRDNQGSPVWLGDSRIQAVSSSSIDKSTVDLDAGELRLGLFDLTDRAIELCEATGPEFSRLQLLAEEIGEASLPQYLLRFINSAKGLGKGSINIWKPATVEHMRDADKELIYRKKGLMGNIARDGKGASHQIQLFFNAKNKGRFVYNYSGSIQFMKNVKNDR